MLERKNTVSIFVLANRERLDRSPGGGERQVSAWLAD